MNSELIKKIVLPLLVLFFLWNIWGLLTSVMHDFPTPSTTYIAAFGGLDADEDEVEGVLTNPFYIEDEEDRGIFWHILTSFQHLFGGFFLSLVMGIPLGILMGISKTVHYALNPFIRIFKSVSPLAWLPLILFLFHDIHITVILIIFVTSIWPIIIHTAMGVKSVSMKYINLSKILQFSHFEKMLQIILPVTVPYIFTGMRLSMKIAWTVIIPSEMLTGDTGIGFWIWDAYNNLEYSKMIIGILLIGIIGLLLDMMMLKIANFFDYRKKAEQYE